MVLSAGLYHSTEGSEWVSRYILVANPTKHQNRPVYLPKHWEVFTHPEGQTYFYRNNGLRVVTEANLYEPKIVDKIDFWANGVANALSVKGIPLNEKIELLLEPSADMHTCEYYLVDHATRSTFWVDQVSSDQLELPPVASITHLSALWWSLSFWYAIYPNFFRIGFRISLLDARRIFPNALGLYTVGLHNNRTCERFLTWSNW